VALVEAVVMLIMVAVAVVLVDSAQMFQDKHLAVAVQRKLHLQA
jgi:hypothetical protein